MAFKAPLLSKHHIPMRQKTEASISSPGPMSQNPHGDAAGLWVVAARSLSQPRGYITKEEKRSLPLIKHHVPKLQVSVHNVFLENNRHMVCTVKMRARVGPSL